MKNISEIFEGGTYEKQKKKKITFYCICVTFAIIVAMLLVLVIFGIVSFVTQKADEKPNKDQTVVTVGETQAVTLSQENIYSGILLLLDSTHPFKGKVDTVVIRSHEGRPKKPSTQEGTEGGNIYSILAGGTTEDKDFRGTADAVDALNLMLKDFYTARQDDNLCIAHAFTKANAATDDPVYASGTAFSLEYYFDYSANKNDIRSIYGVEKYDWIYSNAHKYGFITVKSGKTDENGNEIGSNVFRYVGVPHATYMVAKKLDLNAYLEQLRGATPDAPILTKVGKVTYASYYISADGEHLVPVNYEYSISGNNSDGYIVSAIITK